MLLGRHSGWVALAWLATAPAFLIGAASAQTGASCTVDSAAGMRHERFTVYLMPLRQDGERSSDSVAMALAREVALQYEHPTARGAADDIRRWIHLLRSGPASGDSATAEVASASGIVELKFDPSGALSRIEWIYASPAPSVDLALTTAIRRADSSSAFATLPALRNRTQVLELALMKGQDGAPLPLFQARVRHLDAESPVLRQLRLPEPPRDLRDAAKRAWFEWEFTVGTDGRPELESVRIVAASNPPFEALRDAARTALLRAEYSPGRSGGCSIRMPMRYRMEFRTEVPKF